MWLARAIILLLKLAEEESNSSNTMGSEYVLPFAPSTGRTYVLDDERKGIARSLAAKMGISYNPFSNQNAASQEKHELLLEKARIAVMKAGGPNAVSMEHICYSKMNVDPGSERSLFLNYVAAEAGSFVYDLPDGQGGFVILDPRTERTTAWHPDRATREAACVVGSLILREARARGQADMEDLTSAMNILALDPETGIMKSLERNLKMLKFDQKQDLDVEQITLANFDLPKVQDVPTWLIPENPPAPEIDDNISIPNPDNHGGNSDISMNGDDSC